MYAKVLLSTAVLLAAIRGGRTNDPNANFANCPSWTEWFDVDDPDGNGDYETLPAIRDKHKGAVCDSPTAIEALPIGDTFAKWDNILAENVINGFICKHTPARECPDYHVRFCCPEAAAPECPSWTEWLDDGGSGLYAEIEGRKDHDVCDNPTAIEARVVGTHKSAYDTGEIFNVFSCRTGLVCIGKDQADGKPCEDYEVRFCCPEEQAENPVPTPGLLCSIDIVLVIDVSASTSPSEFFRLLWFLIEFILCFEANGVDVQIGVITYDCLPRSDIPLGEFSSGDLGLLVAMEGLERRGGRSRTGLALHYVKCMADFRKGACPVVVLVSDGTEANGRGTDDYVSQAAMLRDSGIAIYGLAVGYPFLINKAGLATITGSPDRVVDPNDPCGLAGRIFEECCGEN